MPPPFVIPVSFPSLAPQNLDVHVDVAWLKERNKTWIFKHQEARDNKNLTATRSSKLEF
jgi:hypothetical protein